MLLGNLHAELVHFKSEAPDNSDKLLARYFFHQLGIYVEC